MRKPTLNFHKVLKNMEDDITGAIIKKFHNVIFSQYISIERNIQMDNGIVVN